MPPSSYDLKGGHWVHLVESSRSDAALTAIHALIFLKDVGTKSK